MKFYRWLLTLGLVLLATGLIIYSTSHSLDFKSLLMILIGAIVLIIALFRLDLGRILKDRRLLYGGNMLLVIILVTAILGLLNYFSARHSWRVDTNTGKTFSLAPQTVNLLKSLNSDIEIIVFDKRINAGPVENLLKEYAHISKRFSYRLVDPDEKPGLSNQYKVTQYGSLVVIGGNREEQINLATEEALTNAIIKVTRDKTRRVAFITGHGERSINSADRKGFANAEAAIEDQNYVVEELRLAEMDSIPGDISVIIIAGPEKDYFKGELELLTTYLKNGGSGLFLLDPKPGMGLQKYLRKWNISVGSDMVVDASGFGRLLGAGPEIPLVSDYGDHPIVEQLDGLMTFFPLTRSVSVIASDNSKMSATVIARTGQTSYAIGQEKISKREEISIGPEDRRGPIDIACALTVSNDTNRETRIVVVGDSDFASNAYFTNQANGDFFMNIINWLVSDEDLISIRPKNPEMRTVNVTPGQMRLVFWLTVIVLPVLAFALGIVVYRGRH